MRFSIWVEGHRATGDSAGASFIGEAEGETFKEACDSYAAAHPEWAASYYDSSRLTYWGCRLFDNEAEARKAFG